MKRNDTKYIFLSRIVESDKINAVAKIFKFFVVIASLFFICDSYHDVQAQALPVGSGYNDHSLGLSAAGMKYSWGAGSYGQIGNAKSAIGGYYRATLPQDITSSGSLSGKEIKDIAAGNLHSLALATDNTLHVWGDNRDGQLGISTTVPYSAVPVQVRDDVKAIAAGAAHTIILTREGKVYAWGRGSSGQLGDGTTASSVNPVLINFESDNTVTIVAVSASNTYSFALADDGTIYAWGSGSYGQLGNGKSIVSLLKPTPVQFVTNPATKIVAISAGGGHSLALSEDGSVYAWGNGTRGQLGNGKFNSSETRARKVDNLPIIKTVAAGGIHSLALDGQGRTWAWGADLSGQLGNNNALADQHTPVEVTFPISTTSVKAISAGAHHSLAMASDGLIWAWGRGTNGQLGQGDYDTYNYPYPVLVKSTTGSGTLNLGPSCTVLESPIAIVSPVTEANPTGEPITTIAMNTTESSIYQVDNPQNGVTYTWSVTHNSNGLVESVSFSPTSKVGTEISVVWPENEARVYKVNVTASIPGCTSNKKDEIYVAVYDPSAGFVTGGGWITSPIGAYKPLEANGAYRTDYVSPAGKANFGFVSKYKKGSNVVDGKTEFHFNDGNLRFRNSSHTAETLVISGCKATYNGEGIIEGSDFVYKFKVSAVDGQINGGGNIDKFRIKIVEKLSGQLVYDNLMDKDDNYDLNAADAVLSTVLGGGSVAIHQVNLKASSSSSSLVATESEKLIKPLFVIYPNSFSERTTIAFSLNSEENFSLDLYDMKGALVQRIGMGKAEAGNIYTYEVDGRNMSEGIYLARLHSRSMVKSLKLILKR